jgi:hypothetical protein
VAGPDFPAARSDVATLGAESWLAPGVLASATAYRRRTTGLAVPDPVPTALGGLLVADPDSVSIRGRRERLPFVVGDNRAHGLEMSLRKLSGWYTGSVSYSVSASEVRAAGYRYPAPWNRDRSLDATALLHVLRPLRVGAAYTSATGSRYTRFHDGVARCDTEGECRWVMFPLAGMPAAGRAPRYRSLDLLADLSGTLKGMEVGVYAQLRNASDRSNPAAYVSHDLEDKGLVFCIRAPAETVCEPRRHVMEGTGSYSLEGLRRLALVGVRVAF